MKYRAIRSLNINYKAIGSLNMNYKSNRVPSRSGSGAVAGGRTVTGERRRRHDPPPPAERRLHALSAAGRRIPASTCRQEVGSFSASHLQEAVLCSVGACWMGPRVASRLQ
jgi:hypothetical protein